MAFWENVKLVLGAQVAGVVFWVNPPRILDLEVVSISETHNRITLRLNFNDNHKGWSSDCSIGLKLDGPGAPKIDYDKTSLWLFGKEREGSGAIGVALLSLPTVLPLSPAIIVANGVYREFEKHRGISRHSHAILQALEGQLEPPVEKILVEAMQNLWVEDEKELAQVMRTK